MTARNRMDALVFGENVTYCCDHPISSAVGAGNPETQVKNQIDFLFKQAGMANEMRKPVLLAAANELLEKFKLHLASGVVAEAPQPDYPIGIRRS
jgi:hypothetical protein